jgi:hypothetical protein
VEKILTFVDLESHSNKKRTHRKVNNLPHIGGSEEKAGAAKVTSRQT